MSARRLLLADGEPAMRATLTHALTVAGYEVELAAAGTEVLWRLGRGADVDLVVLDLATPGLDGIQVTRRLRHNGHDVPVLVLTGADELASRVESLEAGADDCVVKPYALEELLARMHALLRRRGRVREVLDYDGLVLDVDRRLAERGGRRVKLTRTECSLLELLMRHPHEILSRSAIYEHVWGYDFGRGSNVLDVYVGYVRRKTEAPGLPRLIQTVRGVGYVLQRAQP